MDEIRLISLAEYARRIDRDPATVRQKVLRGKLNAVKIGNTWLIDKDEPYVDYRKNDEDKTMMNKMDSRNLVRVRVNGEYVYTALETLSADYNSIQAANHALLESGIYETVRMKDGKLSGIVHQYDLKPGIRVEITPYKAHMEIMKTLHHADRFAVKHEYYDWWGVDEDSSVVDFDEIVRLSEEWEKSFDELYDQCEII